MLFQHLEHHNPLHLLLKLITLAVIGQSGFSVRKKSLNIWVSRVIFLVASAGGHAEDPNIFIIFVPLL